MKVQKVQIVQWPLQVNITLNTLKPQFNPFFMVRPNRSSTIGGNREMNQLYTTSQVSIYKKNDIFSNYVISQKL